MYKNELQKLKIEHPEYDDSLLKFDLTCSACPEQYDVYLNSNNKLIGYIRLRFGCLSCNYINTDNHIELEDFFLEQDDFSDMAGLFDSEEQREYYLTVIGIKLIEQYTTDLCKIGMKKYGSKFLHLFESFVE